MKFIQTSILKLFIAMGVVFTVMSVSTAFSSEIHSEAYRAQNTGTRCEPTPADYLGPFYKANAPVRSSVGKGYQLTGSVISSEDCTPIAKAAVEFWLTGPDGSYGDDHRATVYSDGSGLYRFESNFPPGYSGRPPHIHIRVSADGFETLATQHYPTVGHRSAKFDLILVPIK